MKEILVIGGTGFLGKKLVPELIKENNVTCLALNINEAKTIRDNRVKILLGNMLNKESVEKAMKNIDTVVHLASSHIDGQKDEINIIGSKNIIDSCKKNKIKQIIFISSMAAKRNKLDEYGKMKSEIETMIKSSMIDYTILRPTMIYDKDNLSLIGNTINMLPFIIPVIGNGNYKLNPVHINNVVETICGVVKNEKCLNKTYDVAGPEKLSFNEIINICKKTFKIKKQVIHVPIKLCLFIFRFFPIVSVEAVKGINEDTNADVLELEKDLRIKLIDFREGIKNVNI